MPRLAIILIHYKTASLLRRAVQALREDLLQSGLDGELIVVDNGSSTADKLVLRELPVRLIDAGANLGYGAGLNLGVKQSEADVLFFMNCDVEVMPGCLAALVQALSAGAAAVGPRFYWDRDRSLHLPPPEERDLLSEIWRRLATCSSSLMSSARARWRRHARRHWTANHSFASTALSGALMGVRRDALETIGPFDEGFKLYFEETDWLQRLKRHGLKSFFVPEAAAVHLYNQSAMQEPEAMQWCIASAQRFQQKYYGSFICALLNAIPNKAVAERKNSSRLPGTPEEFNLAFQKMVSPACSWIELSPLNAGFPAAGMKVTDARSWKLPAEWWQHIAAGTYHLQILDDCDQELQHFHFDVTAAAAPAAILSGGANHG